MPGVHDCLFGFREQRGGRGAGEKLGLVGMSNLRSLAICSGYLRFVAQ